MKNVLAAGLLILLTASAATAQFSDRLYVVNGLSETLSRVDLSDGSVYEDVLPLGAVPNDIVIRDDRAYVVNSGSATLTVIDVTADTLVTTIDLGAGNNPWTGILADDHTMYVSNWLGNSVSRVDLTSGTVASVIPVGTAPEGMVLVGSDLYVANSGWNGAGYDLGTVSVIDTAGDSVVAVIPVGVNPQDLALDPGGEVNVVCTGDYWQALGTVYVIDSATRAVTDSIYTGGAPGRAALTPTGLLYMAAGGWFGVGEVYLVDALRNALVHGAADPILAGVGTMDVAADDEGRMFAAAFADNRVVVFDVPDLPVDSIDVGNGPTAIDIRREPWIEVGATTAASQVHRGDPIDYTLTLRHRGSASETVDVLTAVVMPGGTPFPGNPLLGPLRRTVAPGDSIRVDLSEVIPPGAPMGRYVFFAAARDVDSSRTAIGSFWFDVLP
jgi:YVTN family beta-propeller protein